MEAAVLNLVSAQMSMRIPLRSSRWFINHGLDPARASDRKKLIISLHRLLLEEVDQEK
jgi:hypothetical protein